MLAERLAAMPQWAISFDTETHLIQTGNLAPPLVCASVAQVTGSGIQGSILGKSDAELAFEALLRDERVTICGANIAFDMLVMAVRFALRGVDLMPLIFAAYMQGRVFDLQLAEALHAVAMGHLGIDPRTGKALRDPVTGKPGRYSLAMVTDLVLGRTNAKANDRWRMSYALLEDVPMSDWPPDAKVYPIDDAVNTLEVVLAQCGHLPNVGPHAHCYSSGGPGSDLICPRCRMDPLKVPVCRTMAPRRNLHDHAVRAFSAWSLHLGASWGLRSDPAAVAALEAAAMVGRKANLPGLIARGFVRDDGSENGANVKRAVALAYGCDPLVPCTVCQGTGKIYKKFSKKDPTKPVGTPVGCVACSSTGLDLTTAPVPMSPPSEKFEAGQVKTGRDVLVESGNDDLMEYAAAQEDDKILDTYIPFLKEGIFSPIILRPNPILETGRVSYSGVAQLLPRAVSAHLTTELKAQRAAQQAAGFPAPLVIGVRDCIKARDGWVFYSNDYTGGELVTHAESCVALVGFSKMGEALNQGVDVHSALGATLMGVPYPEFAAMRQGERGPDGKKRANAFRQAAKPANFGFPGGMGAVRMVMQQREQGPDTEWPDGPSIIGTDKHGKPIRGYKGLRFCLLVGHSRRCGEHKVTEWNRKPCAPVCSACVSIAEEIRKAWFRQWPENNPYFDRVSEILDRDGEVVQHYSGRIRGGLEFCAAANGFFQGLLADIAIRADCRVTYEQRVATIVRTTPGLLRSVFEGMPSPLYARSRGILFAHDELFGEAQEVIAPEASERVNEIMIEEFQLGCPNHKPACKAQPTIMRKWYKAAEEVLPYPNRPRNLTDNRLQIWEPKAA